MAPIRWTTASALLGFLASSVLSSILHLSRDLFVALYGTAVALFVSLLLRTERIDPLVQLRRRWAGGIVGGLLVGAILARTVFAQPGSPRPSGGALVWSLLWDGGLYGVVDGLLLNVLPVLLMYGMRPVEELSAPGRRWGWALAAMGASLVVTAAYHAGFAEFRGPTLLAPLIGNTIITLSYLVTGSPLAALLSHVVMHCAAVLHGMASTIQLPPHYP